VSCKHVACQYQSIITYFKVILLKAITLELYSV